MDKTLYLVLENGKVFKGYGIGASGEAIGETIFQTAVLGYNECITDPAYCGQIVVQTFPLIGNYGIIKDELDSKEPALAGYIVKSICDEPSNFRCDGKLDDYLKEKNIVGLAGIDTRELTKFIRDNGTVNGKITADISDIEKIKSELKSYKNTPALNKVSTDKIETYTSDNEEFKVCMLDLGATNSFINSFTSMGITVISMPYSTTAKEIMDLNPDGVIISQGPGNPNDFEDIAKEISLILDKKIPVYACGLGHELASIALGGKTQKHKFGHHGVNQPVKCLDTGRIYITTQNHGYVVDESSLPDTAKVSFVNVNDKTVEGFNTSNLVSTQFAPNLCKGPHNTAHIIEQFKNIMKGDQ